MHKSESGAPRPMRIPLPFGWGQQEQNNPGPLVAAVDILDSRRRKLRRVQFFGKVNAVWRQDEDGARCRRLFEASARSRIRGASRFRWTFPVISE